MLCKTPNGHEVEFRESLNYGDRRAVQRIIQGNFKLNVSSKEGTVEPFPASILMDAQEEIFRRVIVSVTPKGGTKQDTGDLLSVVYAWDEKDGKAVFDFIDKHFQANEVKKT